MVVFLTRYMDLFLYWVSLYNTVLKIAFICLTSYLVYTIKFKRPFCLGYDSNLDSLNHYLFIYPVVCLLTLLFHTTSSAPPSIWSILWTFSVWLEAFAIVPQLYIVYKKREVEVITGTYMAALGCYKGFYILNWIYKIVQGKPQIWFKLVAGVIQFGIFCDFLYYYFISAKVSIKPNQKTAVIQI